MKKNIEKMRRKQKRRRERFESGRCQKRRDEA